MSASDGGPVGRDEHVRPALIAAEPTRRPLAAWTALTGILFVLAVALVAHLAFSAHGFNPTDEGYYLSNARRVLDGEVPHRDFITLRPAGAYYLFAPVVALAGDSTIWVSRFIVLMELATISWLWAVMIQRNLGEPFGRVGPIVPALVAFMLTLGWYPLMVTTTVEGYFSFTAGLAMVVGGGPARKAVGYLVMGYGYICRQNFLFAAVLSLIALGDWRRLRYWIAAGVPGLLYLGWLTAVGGLTDLFLQLGAPSANTTAYPGFLGIGVVNWLRQPLLFVGLLTGLAAGALFRGRRRDADAEDTPTLAAGWALVLAIAVVGSIITLRYGHAPRVPDFRWYSFAVMGLAVGLLAVPGVRLALPAGGVRVALCVLAAAWSVSFSWATAAPTLALGPLVLLSLGLASVPVGAGSSGARFRATLGYALAVLVIPLAAVLYQARQGWIGFDPPAALLTQRVDGVFAGAGHLRTDKNTFAYLQDFQEALRRAPTQDVVIAPDMAAYWIRASRRNPISVNWPYNGELINGTLEQRIIGDLDRKRGEYTFVASKVLTITLADGFNPVPPSWSAVQDTVRRRFNKIGETRYFELYR